MLPDEYQPERDTPASRAAARDRNEAFRAEQAKLGMVFDLCREVEELRQNNKKLGQRILWLEAGDQEVIAQYKQLVIAVDALLSTKGGISDVLYHTKRCDALLALIKEGEHK